MIRQHLSWSAALGAAGLKVTQHWKVPDAVLRQNLADVGRKLGRQPAWRELTQRGGLSKFAGAPRQRLTRHARSTAPARHLKALL